MRKNGMRERRKSGAKEMRKRTGMKTR